MTKIELPEGIFNRIMNRIKEERRVSAVKRRMAVFSFGFIASLAAFIPALRMVWSSFSQSGFLQFFSLLFSDSGTVAVYWKSFTMSLLETFPVMESVIFLVVLIALLESLRLLSKNIKFVSDSKPQFIIN